MRMKHSSNFIHGTDTGSGCPVAPTIQKHSGPVRRDKILEELEGFLQKITANGFEVAPQQIIQFDFLIRRKIIRSFKQTPSRVCKNRRQSFGFQLADFLGSNSINGFVHLHEDMKTIQNMNRLAGFPGNDLKIGFPHVTADEMQLGRSFSPG